MLIGINIHAESVSSRGRTPVLNAVGNYEGAYPLVIKTRYFLHNYMKKLELLAKRSGFHYDHNRSEKNQDDKLIVNLTLLVHCTRRIISKDDI